MITFRRVVPADFPLLGEWLSQPHVARWWNQEFTPEAVERDFGPTSRGEEPAEDFLAFEDGVAFAHAQRSRWVDYPEESAAIGASVDVPGDALTIDYFIGELSQISSGRGTKLIGAFVRDTWRTTLPHTRSSCRLGREHRIVAGAREGGFPARRRGTARTGQPDRPAITLRVPAGPTASFMTPCS